MDVAALQITIIETIYMLVIVASTSFIFWRVRKLYSFSKYKGVKYFADAFLFTAIGFLARYLLMLAKIFLRHDPMGTISHFGFLAGAMGFSFVISALFFLYVLFWKHIEQERYGKGTSLPVAFLVLVAFAVTLGGHLAGSLAVLYGCQISLFVSASIITYIRSRKAKDKRSNFSQLYFISMVLLAIIWTGNAAAQYFIDAIPTLRLYLYAMTIAVNLLLAYITFTLTKNFR
ncbi:MAG: hypothetical protein ACOC32_02795 [Nanoarchaeota archaeon]